MAIHSFGATLELALAASPAFTSLGCIHDISGPGISVTSTDSSCLSTEWKTFIPGLVDAGEITLTIDYSESTYNALHDVLRTVVAGRIEFPDGEEITFDCFITALGLTIPFDDRIVIPLTLKVTGESSTAA